MKSILKKSISEIGGWNWKGDIPTLDNSSYEEYQYYNLHRKPIKDYTIDDIYFMIGQEECLSILVPIALEFLSKDIFVKADDYPTDLLERLLLLHKYWESHPDEKRKLLDLLGDAEKKLDDLILNFKIKKELKKLIIEFRS